MQTFTQTIPLLLILDTIFVWLLVPQEFNDPDDIFRFFFQGGFQQPHRTHHRRYRSANAHEEPQEREQATQKNNVFSLLIAFLPLLLILFLNSSSAYNQKKYSLSKSNSFPIEMRTYRLQTNFFVNSGYTKLDQREKYETMLDVEKEYFETLHSECSREYNTKYRNKNKIQDFPEGTWCHKFLEVKRIMQPGY